MPFYLESMDGSQSYKADFFCTKADLVDGQLYTLEELGFSDWLRTAGSQHKPPQKKLKANWYGPVSRATDGETK
jgi:hypothetical protein